MGTVLLKALVGGIAGVLVWIVFESQAPHGVNDSSWAQFELYYVTALGIVIGASIGAVTGWIQGGKVHMLRGLGLGFLLGALGMTFGHRLGGSLFGSLGGNSLSASLPTRIIARTIAFTLMGAGLGVAIGMSTWNTKRAVQGLTGGAIAGAVSGAVFDIISSMTAPLIQEVRHDTGAGATSEVGIFGRAIMALLLGALIGLFIGLVERLTRSAWVRLILGRNEGREWSIDSPITSIGRSENAAIPLFGDANIGAFHAQIQRQAANVYVLVDGGSPVGTFVNGQRIQTAQLMPGARIQIGGFQLEFLMKNSPSPIRGPEPYRSAQAYPVGAVSPAAAVPYPGPGAAQPQVPAPGMAPGSLYAATSGAPATPTMGQPASNPTVAYGFSDPGSSQLSLVAVDGPFAGMRYAVTAAMVLGRESASVPMSADSQASRRHAEVQPGQGVLQVADLGSTNGTFVNGQRVQTAQLRPGDVLRVGSTSFRVEP